MLRLKLQYFGHLMWRVDSFEKTLMLKDWGQEEKGTTEDEMVGWHHQLDGHGFGWTLAVGDGQGGLVCCGSWGHKESDMTERLNWTELSSYLLFKVFFYVNHLSLFIESVTILLLFYVSVFLAMRQVEIFSSLIEDRIHTHCIGRQSLNHWTTMEVPMSSL